MDVGKFIQVDRSLSDMLGGSYMDSVCAARAFFDSAAASIFLAKADEKVAFYPEPMQERLKSLLDKVGKQVVPPIQRTSAGAGSAKFCAATKTVAAPLSAFGYYRIGEDGRLYLTTKSEHYHVPLGHSFPGYGLLDNARALGIPNATHNNTRGHIVRLLEEELVRTANGLARDDRPGLESLLSRRDDLRVLNRVLNLETGSLVVEAALKMILARFYRMESSMPKPPYDGRTPVILVMGNDDSNLQANYHGTTTLTQMMRGMWPELQSKMDASAAWKIVPIRPNCREDMDSAFSVYEKGNCKIAGFFHEIVMMNYGGRMLTKDFLRHAYRLCEKHDVPTVVDEIQSCLWAPRLYLFREYGLKPSFVAIGKGFPGGGYSASRIIFSAAMDVMPQFGALVTNGQEELAALAYLITMEWAQANAELTAYLGSYYENSIREIAGEFPDVIMGVDGWRHMTTLCFVDLEKANAFASELNRRGFDISAQIYKADCPPVALTKLPLIADQAMIDFVIRSMRAVLGKI
jgi:4-aminobutyrate aminotransferase-like enzyme